MPTVTLKSLDDRFPDGTSVSVYLEAGAKDGSAPSGPAVATATVAGGQAVFAGLAYTTRYVAYALVGGVHRYVRFRTDDAPRSVESAVALSSATGDGIADDTAAINAVLTDNPGRVVRGVPGRTYLVSAPIVVPSDTTLDMTGCTVKLKPGSNTNIVVNKAVTTNLRVIDATMTSASAVLTSATAAFTDAVIGQPVVVQGAGAAGVPLVSTVASRQSATQVTLADAAGTTVSSRYAGFGTRDARIVIRGGVWDRQNNSGSVEGYLKTSLRLRQVDGVLIEDMQWKSLAGKYSVNVGDVSEFVIQRITAVRTESDLVHVNGPAHNGAIRDITSRYSGDDVVSLTAADFNTVGLDTMQDCVGDIYDVRIDNIRRDLNSANLGRALLLIAGQSPDSSQQYTISSVDVRDVSGDRNATLVTIGDDNQDARTQRGIYRDVVIDNVRQENGTGIAVWVHTTNAATDIRGLEFRSIAVPRTSSADAIVFDGPAVMDRIRVMGVERTRINAASASAISRLWVVDPSEPYDTLTTEVETLPRLMGLAAANATLTSGTVLLTYFRPVHDRLVTNILTITGGVVAAGGTLARVGLYSINTSTGDATLLNASVNDATMWSAAFSGYNKALAGSVQVRAGFTYALGVLFVGTTAPKIGGVSTIAGGELLLPPRLAGSVTAQADLPATILNASIGSAAGSAVYAKL